MKAESRQAMLQTITSGKKELKRNRDLFNSEIYAAEYVKQANIDMSIYEVVLPASALLKWDDELHNLIIVVLAGQLWVNEQQAAGVNDVIVAPAGQNTSLRIDGEQSVHALLMIRRAAGQLKEVLIRNQNQCPWIPDVEDGHVHLYLKNVLTPEEIGGCLMCLDYPAGHVTEWHDHDFTHAAYIVDGVFLNETQFDKQACCYGPGSFICGPKAQIMRHGATPEQNCHCWFFTDQRFGLHYLDAKAVSHIKAD